MFPAPMSWLPSETDSSLVWHRSLATVVAGLDVLGFAAVVVGFAVVVAPDVGGAVDGGVVVVAPEPPLSPPQAESAATITVTTIVGLISRRRCTAPFYSTY